MSLDKAIKNLKYDKRMLEWNLNNGQITKEEYNKFINELPDLADQVSALDLDNSDSDSSEESH